MLSVRQSHGDNYEAAIGRDYHLTFEEAIMTKLNIIVQPGFAFTVDTEPCC